MLASDSDALQDLLLSVCQRAELRSLSGLDVQRVLDDILCRTRHILADVAYNWNQPRTSCQLPAEVLALCFAFLPFQSRIHASHVCRVWRAAALGSPSLWADVDGASKHANPTLPVLEMALSRAGAVPLALRFGQTLKGETLQLVHRLMHRVARLDVHKIHDTSLLRRPAPLLHTLRVASGELRLTEKFLGGFPGRLAGLHADEIGFPESCAALCNLTTLEFRFGNHVPLQHIFALCPRLQRLSVKWAFWSDAVPIGPFPDSLTELTLCSFANPAQLLPVIAACNSAPNLKRVHLELKCGCNPDDLGPALRGVVDLRVISVESCLVITATYRDGRRLRLKLGDMFPSAIFEQSALCFSNLHTLHVELGALERFVSVAPPLPSLLKLCVEISAIPESEPRVGAQPKYPWHQLRSLASLTPRRVVLNVLPRAAHQQSPTCPTMDDARALVSVLVDASLPFGMRVIGFAPDVNFSAVSDLTNGLDIEFV